MARSKAVQGSSKSGVGKTNRRSNTTNRKTNKLDWAKLPESELLDVRICDLELQIEGTLKTRVEQLYEELGHHGLKFKPHCWLSDDWYSPDGIPGIAIPFFLAHPRLVRLERKQMLEVEGGTKESCMRILRHEAGHAFDTAYRLNRKKTYRKVFGRYSDPYPEYYRPKPSSKRYVLHLEPWYAQSHPAEDFAETFAVWLKPNSRWRRQYEGWPALKKVQLVDELMDEVNKSKLKVRSRAKTEPVSRISKTLRKHYDDRRAFYSIETESAFDHDLKKLFVMTPPKGSRRSAAAFLNKNANDLCRTVAQWSGEYRYNINQVLREMIERCRELKLVVGEEETIVKRNAAVLLTVHTMNHLHGGHHRVAL